MRKYTKKNGRKTYITQTKRRKWKRNKSIRRYIHKRSLTGGATCSFSFQFAEHQYDFEKKFDKHNFLMKKSQYKLTKKNKTGDELYTYTFTTDGIHKGIISISTVVNTVKDDMMTLYAMILLYKYKNDYNNFCYTTLLNNLSKEYKPTKVKCDNCIMHNTPFHSITDDIEIIKLIIQNKDNHNETKKLLYTYGIIKYLYPDAKTANLYFSMPISKIDRTLPDIFSKIKPTNIYSSNTVNVYKNDKQIFKIIKKNMPGITVSHDIAATIINECINYDKILSLCDTTYLCELTSICLEQKTEENVSSLNQKLRVNVYIYILMQNCGDNLFNIISMPDIRITEDIIYKWFYNIALGIQSMHLKNCVHRDIKPENISIDSSCKAKLIDFGQAICLDDYSFYGLKYKKIKDDSNVDYSKEWEENDNISSIKMVYINKPNNFPENINILLKGGTPQYVLPELYQLMRKFSGGGILQLELFTTTKKPTDPVTHESDTLSTDSKTLERDTLSDSPEKLKSDLLKKTVKEVQNTLFDMKGGTNVVFEADTNMKLNINFFKKCDIYSLGVSLVISLSIFKKIPIYYIKSSENITLVEAISMLNKQNIDPLELIESLKELDAENTIYQLCDDMLKIPHTITINQVVQALEAYKDIDITEINQYLQQVELLKMQQSDAREFLEVWQKGV